MDRRAIIATHHKTGTTWMKSTFQRACAALDIPCLNLRPQMEFAALPAVILDDHSHWFGKVGASHDAASDRVLHVIRDPRDVIISAMHYHRTAPEVWLHTAQDKFGGLTYQEKINGLASDRERYIFEMDNSSGNVIRAMGRWDYARPECFECRYEDLMADPEMGLFTRAIVHLGFGPEELETCRQAFWTSSLFGGIPQERKRTGQGWRHIRSGRPRQWTDVFDRELASAFLNRFGDILVRLGYEPDNSWAENCGDEEVHESGTV